jgi:hypothetical protein
MTGQMSTREKLDAITRAVFVGFCVAFAYHFILGNALDASYPWNTFLFRPWERFNDFYECYGTASAYTYGFKPNGLAGSSYFPFYFPFFFVFTLAGRQLSLVLYIAVFVTYFAGYNYFNMRSTAAGLSGSRLVVYAGVLSFLTYPFLFVIDRGNLDMYMFILLSAFLYFYVRGLMAPAVVFLSCAIALKLYPAVFVVLFLQDRKYKEALFVPLLASALCAGSLMSLDGGFGLNLQSFIENLKVTDRLYNIAWPTVTGGASGVLYEGIEYRGGLWNIFRVAAYLFLGTDDPYLASGIFLEAKPLYTALALAVFLATALYIAFIERELWKKAALLTFLLLLPTSPSDYMLIYLFIPLWLFIRAEGPREGDSRYALGFALLLVPKAYYFLFGTVSISVLANPLILSWMLCSMVCAGFRERVVKGREALLANGSGRCAPGPPAARACRQKAKMPRHTAQR